MKSSFKEWFFDKLVIEMSEEEAESILGVKRGDPSLKTRYRQISAKNHPDVGGSEDQMKRINAAMALLSSPPKAVPVQINPRAQAQAQAQKEAQDRAKADMIKKSIEHMCASIDQSTLLSVFIEILRETRLIQKVAMSTIKDNKFNYPINSEEDAANFLNNYYRAMGPRAVTLTIVNEVLENAPVKMCQFVFGKILRALQTAKAV